MSSPEAAGPQPHSSLSYTLRSRSSSPLFVFSFFVQKINKSQSSLARLAPSARPGPFAFTTCLRGGTLVGTQKTSLPLDGLPRPGRGSLLGAQPSRAGPCQAVPGRCRAPKAGPGPRRGGAGQAAAMALRGCGRWALRGSALHGGGGCGRRHRGHGPGTPQHGALRAALRKVPGAAGGRQGPRPPPDRASPFPGAGGGSAEASPAERPGARLPPAGGTEGREEGKEKGREGRPGHGAAARDGTWGPRVPAAVFGNAERQGGVCRGVLRGVKVSLVVGLRHGSREKEAHRVRGSGS